MVSCSAYPQLMLISRIACVSSSSSRKEQKWISECPQSKACLKSLAPSICRHACSEAATLPSQRHGNITRMQVLSVLSLKNLFLPDFYPFGSIQNPFLVWFCFVLLSSVCDTEGKEEVYKNLSLTCILYAGFIAYRDLTCLLEPDLCCSRAFCTRSLQKELILLFLSKCMLVPSNKVFKRMA